MTQDAIMPNKILCMLFTFYMLASPCVARGETPKQDAHKVSRDVAIATNGEVSGYENKVINIKDLKSYDDNINVTRVDRREENLSLKGIVLLESGEKNKRLDYKPRNH